MSGILDVLKKGAGTVLNPFGQKPKDPLNVGRSNDSNYNAFMDTDYSKFKDAQGNFVPSSLIGTNVGVPPAPDVSMSNLPTAPSFSQPMPTLMPGISPPPKNLPGLSPSVPPTPSVAGIGLPHPDLSVFSPPSVTPPASAKPQSSIAPPTAFTPSQVPGLFNDGQGGTTRSVNSSENQQYGYWGNAPYSPPGMGSSAYGAGLGYDPYGAEAKKVAQQGLLMG